MATNKKYQRDYLDSVKRVIPEFYFSTDQTLSGYQRTATDSVVNTHINFCINQPTIFDISATTNYSGIDQVSGMGQWFLLKNNLTNITSKDFELDIMHPLGYCIGEYTGQKCTFFTGDNQIIDHSADQEATFISFLKDTLLPKITLNSSALATTTASAFDNEASGTHEYLIKTLGWAYFLNTSGTSFSPSSYVASAIGDLYFKDDLFNTVKGIKGLTNFIWKDWASLSATYPALLDTKYFSGTGTYTSGTQGLSSLETLIDVIYSDKLLNEGDSYVEDAISQYISTGDLLTGQELAGPFVRFLQALSYSFFDRSDDAQKISSIYDIEKCPSNLLPYVADLIGWRLHGSSPDSWRRQLRNASSLYKQKGTRAGLYNAITTVFPSIDFQLSSISEFYESYIPSLLYYLLKTDTTIFDSFKTFTYQKSEQYMPGDYDPTNMDVNVRKVVDWILLRAVKLFPDLFWVKSFQFDLDDPEFSFFYRGRAFPIPPWEEEKFYTNCDITDDLLAFFERELVCLGVSESNASKFRTYISDNTVGGSLDAKYYNNGFFFLTSSINQPPNRDDVINNFEVDKYDYFPIWSSKSSHFDVDVSSGSFDASFFQGKDFLKQDFFQSLSIVDSLTPSKAIPRTRVTLETSETVSSLDYSCPSLRYPIYDMPSGGTYAGGTFSGVDFRGITGAFGSDHPTPPNSSRSIVTHTNLPVFDRSFIDHPLDKANLMGSSITQTQLSGVERNNMRRRNFGTSLQKSGLYNRTGFNMPSYFNTSSEGSNTEYQSLGLLNLIFKYNKVINPYNLLEVSSFPYNLDVWDKCWDLSSSKDMSGVAASSTFDIRGNTPIIMSSCNSYVARDRTPDFYKNLYGILENNIREQANFLIDTNGFVLGASSFMDLSTSLYNYLWDTNSITEEDVYNAVLGNRRVSRGSLAGIHKTFKDYITYYQGHGTGSQLLTTIDEGGLNILSHAYGPLLYNANLTIEGSGVDASVSSQLISRTISSEYPFSVKDLTGINNLTASDSSNLYVQDYEYRNPYVLSGVEITDSITGTSKFTIFNLDPSTAVRGEPNYLINNPIVVCKPSGGLSRLRYSVEDYGPLTNVIVPEHEFEFKLKAAFGTEDSVTLGDGAFGAWIHTDVEYDYYGNPVFWTYMPNGEWEQMSPSMVSGSTGISNVLTKLSHSLNYTSNYTTSSSEGTCFLTESNKDVLVNITSNDFLERTFKFNTTNSNITVPLSYYQKQQQVHRSDQNYTIEVFMYNLADPLKFGIIDSVEVKDLTQFNRLTHKHSFTYDDYSIAKSTLSDGSMFVDSDGVSVPSNTQLNRDSNGNITTSSGENITYLLAGGKGGLSQVPILYTQINANEDIIWKSDSNGTPLKMDSGQYTGNFLTTGGVITSPPGITITGKTRGSNITKDKVLSVPYSEVGTLSILREFNRLQKDLAARNATISNPRYGPEGGSRTLYDVAPMWSQQGGHTTFESNYNQYTDIVASNSLFYGLRRASFTNSQSTRYKGWHFPTAGDPTLNQLTVYPDFRDADASGYVYYDVGIDLDYPASAGTEIGYTISGTGTTNNYLIRQPWSIVDGYDSPLSIAAYDTSASIRVRLDASAGLSTWNEYCLIFKLDPATSQNVYFTGPYARGEGDEFKLYSKTALVSSVMGAGNTFSGCTIPPVLWFSSTAQSQTGNGTKAIPVVTHGASGPGLPRLNEPCYWYWTSAGGTLPSANWHMSNDAGDEVQQGEYIISGDNPQIYITVKGGGTGTLIISGNYERVDLSAQGASSFSLVSAMDENLWNGTDKWSSLWYQDPNDPSSQYTINKNRSVTFPDDPSGGQYVSNAEVFHQPILNLPDSSATDSRGNPLRVHYLTSSYEDPATPRDSKGSVEKKIPYMRKDLEGQYNADGSLDYFPVKRYTLFSVKVQDPSPSGTDSTSLFLSGGPGSDYGPAQYFRLSLRDKGSNVQVSSWPDPLHPDSQANATVNFKRDDGGTGPWIYDSSGNAVADINPPNVRGGVVSGTDHAGNDEHTLWILRDDITSSARMDYAGINMLIRPIYSPTGNLKTAMGGDWGMLSGAICMYDPFLQTYASANDPDIVNLDSNILPEFWPLEYNQWEPRGGLVTPKAGSTFSNTFTLTVTP